MKIVPQKRILLLWPGGLQARLTSSIKTFNGTMTMLNDFRYLPGMRAIPAIRLALLACFCLPNFGMRQDDSIFPNSVVSNDIDFIHTDDPTVPHETIWKARGCKEMPSSLTVDSLMQDDCYVLQLKFEDGASVGLWAEPGFESKKVVSDYAKKIGDALGKLPKAMRQKLRRVILHKGDRVASSEHQGHFFIMYSENIDARVSTHDLEESVFHETIHATLEARHATSPEWLMAQKKDGDFITAYAASKPRQEDLPESALFAYTLIHHPGRMPAEVEKAVREIMPNRLDYLRNLFADVDTAVGLTKESSPANRK